MKTTNLILLSLFAIQNCLSAQQDSTDLLIGNWYLNGYGKKEISVNDTVQFTKEKMECNIPDCDFKEWIMKSNGDFEDKNFFTMKSDSAKHSFCIGTSLKDIKWGVFKKAGELIISEYKKNKSYRILSVSSSKLRIKRLK